MHAVVRRYLTSGPQYIYGQSYAATIYPTAAYATAEGKDQRAAPPVNMGTTSRVLTTIARMAQQLQQELRLHWAEEFAGYVYQDLPEWRQLHKDIPLE